MKLLLLFNYTVGDETRTKSIVFEMVDGRFWEISFVTPPFCVSTYLRMSKINYILNVMRKWFVALCFFFAYISSICDVGDFHSLKKLTWVILINLFCTMKVIIQNTSECKIKICFRTFRCSY